MRKTFTLLFIVIAFESYSQSPLQSVAKSYFRTHPFNSKFSTFVLNLQRDPWFTITEFNRRTDSTFFYLTGTYKNFNPFRFAPTELKLVVAEEEIFYSDSLQTLDTIMNFQLIGTIDTNASSIKLVEKEFKRFHQSQSNYFDRFVHKILGGADSITGEINSYFISPYSISPATIAWGVMPDTKKFVFAITIRFKLKENYANYIAAPGDKPDDIIINMNF